MKTSDARATGRVRPPGARLVAIALPLLVALGVVPQALAAPALRHTADQEGDFLLFGNTAAFDCEAAVPRPVAGAVTCPQTQNFSSPDVFWRADEPSVGAAVASATITAASARSTAVLRLPAGAQITYARLYWGGVRSGAQNDTGVLVERPGSGGFAQAVTADAATDAQFSGGENVHYQSTSDVTALLQARGAGAYRVSGLDSVEIAGRDDNRVYVAWSIVVFYRLEGEPRRNLTLFDGLDIVEMGKSTSVELRGFLVPLAGFDAKLGVVAYEGDDLHAGDSLAVNGTPLSNPLNPVDNFFNGSRSWLGVAVSNPGDLPQTTGGRASMGGVDLDVVDIKSVVAQGDTSAQLQASTTDENFLLGVFVTSIATYKPDFVLTNKTYTNLTTRPGGGVRPGDVIEYTVTTTNTGNDVGVGVSLADPIPVGLTYVPGSLRVVAGPNAGTKSDAAGDDQGEYDAAARIVTVRLGAGASATAAGAIGRGEATTVAFRVTVDATASGTIANQAVVTAAGQAGAPPQRYPSDGDGTPGSQPTTFPIDGCATNADCRAPTPICVQKGSAGRVCVECGASADCPAARPLCDLAANVCRACAVNADCPAATPVCDAAARLCRPCRVDAECGADRPLCLPSGACGACRTSVDCRGTTPVCAPESATCQPCRGDGAPSCPDPQRPVCQVAGPLAGACSAVPDAGAGGPATDAGGDAGISGGDAGAGDAAGGGPGDGGGDGGGGAGEGGGDAGDGNGDARENGGADAGATIVDARLGEDGFRIPTQSIDAQVGGIADAAASGDGAGGPGGVVRVSGGGCQCAVDGGGARPGEGAWLLAPLAVFVLARRRRR